MPIEQFEHDGLNSPNELTLAQQRRHNQERDRRRLELLRGIDTCHAVIEKARAELAKLDAEEQK